MTNLSIHICDTSASLVLTSASYADQSLSSAFSQTSLSASYAPSTSGASTVTWYPVSTTGSWTSNNSTAITPNFTISLSSPVGVVQMYFQCIHSGGSDGYPSGSILSAETVNAWSSTNPNSGVGAVINPVNIIYGFTSNSVIVNIINSGNTDGHGHYSPFPLTISNWQYLFRVTSI